MSLPCSSSKSFPSHLGWIPELSSGLQGPLWRAQVTSLTSFSSPLPCSFCCSHSGLLDVPWTQMQSVSGFCNPCLCHSWPSYLHSNFGHPKSPYLHYFFHSLPLCEVHLRTWMSIYCPSSWAHSSAVMRGQTSSCSFL